MGFVYSNCNCGCALARGPAKLDVVDASRISPYRVIRGKAVATVAPSLGNNWSLSTLTLGESASPSAGNLVVLPDSICGSTDRWQLSGGGRITTPQAGLEVGIVFDYRGPSQYSVAGVRTLLNDLSLGAKHEAFLRTPNDEKTCPVYCQIAGALIGTPWVWRRGDYVFCQLPTTSQTMTSITIPGVGTLPEHVTRSGLFAESIAEGQGQIGLWSKGQAVQCSFSSARRHNYRLPANHKHFKCAPTAPIGVVNNYVGAYGAERDNAVQGFEVGALFDEGLHTKPKRVYFPLATYPPDLPQFAYTTAGAPNPYPGGGDMRLTHGSYCDYGWTVTSTGATYRAVRTLATIPGGAPLGLQSFFPGVTLKQYPFTLDDDRIPNQIDVSITPLTETERTIVAYYSRWHYVLEPPGPFVPAGTTWRIMPDLSSVVFIRHEDAPDTITIDER